LALPERLNGDHAAPLADRGGGDQRIKPDIRTDIDETVSGAQESLDEPGNPDIEIAIANDMRCDCSIVAWDRH